MGGWGGGFFPEFWKEHRPTVNHTSCVLITYFFSIHLFRWLWAVFYVMQAFISESSLCCTYWRDKPDKSVGYMRYNYLSSPVWCFLLQERLLLSLLPAHIARVMKAEIIQRLQGPKFGQVENTNNFHNLYVQRHTNVRCVTPYHKMRISHYSHNHES